MNINDIDTAEVEVPEMIWPAIWIHQKNLHDKYKPIEEATGLGHGLIKDRKFDINDQRSQYLLKDMFWRITEEICEAKEAKLENNEDHYWEEMIDALHFMMETYVVIGIDTPAAIGHPADPDPVYWLGLAANCLKQKPWKQTHMITDEPKFMTYLDQAFFAIVWILESNFTNEEIYLLYFKKNQVNQFRQRSKY